MSTQRAHTGPKTTAGTPAGSEDAQVKAMITRADEGNRTPDLLFTSRPMIVYGRPPMSAWPVQNPSSVIGFHRRLPSSMAVVSISVSKISPGLGALTAPSGQPPSPSVEAVGSMATDRPGRRIEGMTPCLQTGVSHKVEPSCSLVKW
jgi:hypothetical protein